VLGVAARGHDAIRSSAGVSAGDEDHVRAVVRSLGGLDFDSVAIKPGRPVAAGHIANVPFFGMPGNPVAMLMSFLFIVRPALLRLAGAAVRPPARFPVRANFSLSKRVGRREFVRCTIETRGDGLYARKPARDGAGVLSTLLETDGILDLDEAMSDTVPGALLSFIPYSEFGL
jgi:molybdopterin molybdotransferase